MESIIGLFKTEAIATTVVHDGPYKALADVEYVAAGWVDWYNHRRLHGSLGWLTPGRVRAGPRRCPQPRAATRIGAGENP
jgi:putative transposase